MITLTTSGDSVVFVFDNNDHYLQQGTIEVPMNSLSLLIDSSDMVTFKKAASNDVFVSATLSELGMTKEQLISFYKENMVSEGGVPEEEIQAMIASATSGYADSVTFNSDNNYIEFYHDDTKVYELDASDFVIDGMIDDVRIETIGGVSYLVIDFNTASGKQDIQIPLTDIFDPSNYYTKTDIDTKLGSGFTSSSVTEVIESNERVVANAINSLNAEISGKVDTDTYTAYTAATDAALSGKLDASAYTPTDLSNYWTSAETESAITQATSGKQDTLIAGDNITISGNVISASGGGGSVTVDSELSTTSENPVQNKVVTAALNGKGDSLQWDLTSTAKKNIPLRLLRGNSVLSDKALRLGDYLQYGYPSASALNVTGLTPTSAITSSVTSASTDSQVPSAKAVYDAIQSGGSIEVSSAITSGDTNPVQGGVLYDKFDEVETVTAAALNSLNDNFDGLKLKKVTQAEYDNLVSGGTVDNSTLYVITNS